MQTQTRIYQREKLYDEIWSEPATTVAPRYGVTSVALGKLCARMGIPTPPRGYWMRLAAGTADPRPRLPALRRGQPSEVRVEAPLRSPRASRERLGPVSAELLRERDEAWRMSVPDVLTDPHRLVQQAAKRLPKISLDLGFLWRKTCIAIGVSAGLRERALRVMDTLLKALERRGWPVEVTPHVPEEEDRWGRRTMGAASVTRVNLGDVHVQVSLVEDKDRVVIHPPPPNEPPARRRGAPAYVNVDLYRPRLEYRPNGRLCFQLDCEGEVRGARRRWCESETVRMEDMLNKVVEGMILLAEGARQERAEAAARQRAYEQAEAQRQRAEQKEREEKARQEDLARRAAMWRRAGEMEAFITEVERAAHEQGKLLSTQSPHARWLAWAHEYVGDLRDSAFRDLPAGLPEEQDEADAPEPSPGLPPP